MEVWLAAAVLGVVAFLVFRLRRVEQPPSIVTTPRPKRDDEALPPQFSPAEPRGPDESTGEKSDNKTKGELAPTARPRELSPVETAVLEKHLAELQPGTDFDPALRIEAATRRCLSEILERAGKHDMLPLRRWGGGLHGDILALWQIVETRLKGKILEERARASLRKEEAFSRAMEAERIAFDEMRVRQKPAIDTFLSIARRKLRAVDEYGDPDWRTLGPDFVRFLKKVAAREGQSAQIVISNFLGDEPSNVIDENGEIQTKPIDPEEDLQRSFVPNYRWLLLSQHVLTMLREPSSAKEEQSLDWGTLSGVDFEAELAQLFKRLGFENVRGTPATGDQGADLVFETAGKKHVVQAKRYSQPVGNSAVQEVIAAREFYGADEAWVVTNATFTAKARELAGVAGVRLIDGEELREMMSVTSEK